MTSGRAAPRTPVAEQLDLFDAPLPLVPGEPEPLQELNVADFDDEALIRALPVATGAVYRPLIEESGRRRLHDAVPALDALCRHFKGFGTNHPVMEQTASLRSLAAIGGWDAAWTVAKLIADGVIEPPGLPAAIAAAARLGCRVPAAVTMLLLGHQDPAVRTDAAVCANASDRTVAAALTDLLTDPHPAVVQAAAQALGRHGRTEARPVLIDLLQTAPSVETIASAAVVADETVIILIGRIARTRPDLADAALEALGDIDDKRAADLLARLRPPG